MLEPTLMFARPISSDGGSRPARLAVTQAELSERLRSGVERAASRNADAIEALRIAVCEFTLALKARGTSPEGVLISLKAVLHEQARSLVAGHPSDASVYALHQQVSAWSIREFFRESDA